MPVSLGTLTIAAMYLGTTAISSGYLGTTQVFGGSTFSPSSLFAASEPGVWYDPSDLTTLFQDTAGTTPVTTAGQTVALMLDKSKGLALGTELVTNGTFDSGTTGWFVNTAGPTLSWDTQRAKVVVSGVGQGITQTSWSPVAGRWYRVTFTATNGAASARGFAMTFGGGGGDAGSVNAGQSRTFTIMVLASSTASLVLRNAGGDTVSGETFFYDNISVRELPGFHATQATAASRPTFGVVPLGGRRNLLLQTEAFSDAAWTKTACTVTDQGGGVWRVQASAASTWVLSQSLGLDATANMAIDVKSNGAGSDTFRVMVDGVVSSDFTATSAWQRFSYSRTHVGAGSNGISRSVANGAIDVLIRFPQLELGSTATAYQKVTTAFDVTEAGVQSLSYLSFDGVDDGMLTPSIGFNADKMTVFAGLRKANDATRGIVAETSAAAASGAWNLNAPNGTAIANYAFRNIGTSSADVVTSSTFAAPTTNVLTAIGDIAGDISQIRVNGSLAANSTNDLGSGNYAANILYIGRRGGTTLPFSGNLYSLIVRNAATDASTITASESWVAGKTGVVL